ncbi:MAG: helix-turn-helix domain-containing protein, partial [Rhodospirillaceae bacterium]
MNKADPFGEMSSREESATGDEPVVAEPSKREVEPVEADHVGALLCATRMRAGGDLQEIAKVLRIRYGYLVAIEDGRHEDLPGSAYSIGFIRAYADYLGLDGNEVVRRLREETNGTVTTARFKFPAPSGESGLPNGGVLAIAVVMGMVVYGAWYTITNADRDAVDLIQEVPDRLAGLIDAQEQDVVDGRGFTKEDTTSLSRTDDAAAAPNESDN